MPALAAGILNTTSAVQNPSRSSIARRWNPGGLVRLAGQGHDMIAKFRKRRDGHRADAAGCAADDDRAVPRLETVLFASFARSKNNGSGCGMSVTARTFSRRSAPSRRPITSSD
jgi:hypothetical protein